MTQEFKVWNKIAQQIAEFLAYCSDESNPYNKRFINFRTRPHVIVVDEHRKVNKILAKARWHERRKEMWRLKKQK